MYQVNSLPWILWSLFISENAASDEDYSLTLFAPTLFWAFVQFILVLTLYAYFIIPPALPANALVSYWAQVFVVSVVVLLAAYIYKYNKKKTLKYGKEYDASSMVKARYVIRLISLLGTAALILLYQLPQISLWGRILAYWGAQQVWFIILAFIEYYNVRYEEKTHINSRNSDNENNKMRELIKEKTGFYSGKDCTRYHIKFNLAVLLLFATFFIAYWVVDITQVFIEINTGWLAIGIETIFLFGYAWYTSSRKSK